MGSGDARNLIVRIGGVGCLLDLTLVVEIREQIAGFFDFSYSDPELGIVGALNFRQTRIPVVDPCLRLDLNSTTSIEKKIALVLKSSEGNWALLVDRVEGISPADCFIACEIPPLLKTTTQEFYAKLELYRQEPMIVLEPERFYGSSVAVA